MKLPFDFWYLWKNKLNHFIFFLQNIKEKKQCCLDHNTILFRKKCNGFISFSHKPYFVFFSEMDWIYNCFFMDRQRPKLYSCLFFYIHQLTRKGRQAYYKNVVMRRNRNDNIYYFHALKIGILARYDILVVKIFQRAYCFIWLTHCKENQSVSKRVWMLINKKSNQER